MDFKYLVEGEADIVLMEIFQIPPKKIFILNGISNIVKELSKKNNPFIFVSRIDDDKKKHSYFNNFIKKDESDNIILKYYEAKNQSLIILKPAIEKFILNNAKKSEIDIKNYKLPEDFKQFRNTTKSLNIRNNNDFRNLLKAIKNSNNPDFKKILTFLQDIHTSNSLPNYWN